MIKVKIANNYNMEGFIYEARIRNDQIDSFIDAEMSEIKTEYDRNCKAYDYADGIDEDGNRYAQIKECGGEEFVRLTVIGSR